LAAILESELHQAELRISGAKSSIADLEGFRNEEESLRLTSASGVDTLLESVAEGLVTRDWVDAVVSTTLRHEMFRVIPCWDELLAVDAEFHKITYR
jgi:hypothetical protein